MSIPATAATFTGDIETFLRQNEEKDLLRFTTAGSVDDGKSTLIGRLLYDSQGVYEDQLASVTKATVSQSVGPNVSPTAPLNSSKLLNTRLMLGRLVPREQPADRRNEREREAGEQHRYVDPRPIGRLGPGAVLRRGEATCVHRDRRLGGTPQRVDQHRESHRGGVREPGDWTGRRSEAANPTSVTLRRRAGAMRPPGPPFHLCLYGARPQSGSSSNPGLWASASS